MRRLVVPFVVLISAHLVGATRAYADDGSAGSSASSATPAPGVAPGTTAAPAPSGLPAPDPQADALAEATRLEAALEYEQALAIVERVIASGTATDPAHLADLHFFAGRLAGGLDRFKVAHRHFAHALELRPELSLPAGTSPKLTAPFDAAREHFRPVRVKAVATNTGEVTLQIDQYPFNIARGIGFELPDGTIQRGSVPPAGARAAVALDEFGNIVWRGPVPPPLPPLPSEKPYEPPPFYARQRTWAVVALTGLVVGSLSAWRFQVAQDEWDQASQDGVHDYSQLRAIESRGRNWGIAADVGLGVGAAAAITVVVLRLTHHGASRFNPTSDGVAYVTHF